MEFPHPTGRTTKEIEAVYERLSAMKSSKRETPQQKSETM